MVSRLDDPQPTFPLPPIEEIPDEVEDKPLKDKLIETRLGALDLPPVIFGAASFSAFYNAADHVSGVIPVRTTRLALRYGIRAFDTSPYYGPSEIILGNALKALEQEFPRSSYIIMTKCGRFGSDPASFDYSPKGVRASVQRSLTRLHTSYLDNVYLHDVEFLANSVAPRLSGSHLGALGAEEEAYGLNEGQESKIWGEGDQKILGAIGELRKMQEEGIIKNIGISGYSLPTLLRLTLLALHTAPYKPLDTLLSYSHLDLQNASLEAFLPAFYERAKLRQVLTASPFSMGLLTHSPPSWHPASPEIKQAVVDVSQIVESWKGGLPDVALGYAFQRAKVQGMPIVVGLSTLKDVHESARTWKEIEGGSEEERSGRRKYEQDARNLFEARGLLDHSWKTPSF
ncbi:hypothetical protein SERLA73DRAFT_176907 [Serpula lacrymans var. lacrymans S7.3]|uniref:NADP-dependent oxidoreductase domain-containing protein n=2 Tax=Serpula lacrymans var. lacrymans TaxID=341189 RepID=F8PQE4_SERL3|nr:uncharacterized protein SERLADRAFT_460225 [Serpula lacrymans var. lacrymans S7.9]EGO01557.1 hypothetical protein SERLA73DRAFT_176907 [Serpula lacrymans var. lacrymans S7.3]EGO27211.1 hypothetical protein SERLADRAFT_460225 [Serpula lacrymans var. lacrymans S7.9]